MKNLYRSSEHRVLFGIFGGIAEYFSVDPLIIRLVVLFCIIVSSGSAVAPLIVLYCIGVFFIPSRSISKIKNDPIRDAEIVNDRTQV